METQLLSAAIAALMVVAATLAVLWLHARRDASDTARLAQAGANEAHARFSAFSQYGEESDYWGGVAGFYALVQARALLENGSVRGRRSAYSEVYDALLHHPGRAMAHMDDIVAAAALLADDAGSAAADAKIAELQSLLSE